MGKTSVKTIEFNRIEAESAFLHPRQNFEPFCEKFQVRFDPLTGRTTHYSHFGAIKPQRIPVESYRESAVKGFCPFCPEVRDKVTPKFPENILPEGRLSKGEAVLFPNMFPYDVYSAVTVMTDEHVVPVEALNGTRLVDSFSLGIDFLKRVKFIDQSLPYHIMTWNYMPPSGGGLVHPHQQYFATKFPGNQFMDEYRASKEFFEKYGVSYWKELINTEKDLLERFIGSVGNSHWIASFASLGMLGDVMCIFPEIYSIDDFTEVHITQLVSGLEKVFEYYKSNNIFSFNASLVFWENNQEFFSTHFRIIPRTFLNVRDYAPDFNFYQALLQEPICVVLPEDLCRDVRKYFES